jgi:hypothetical protein
MNKLAAKPIGAPAPFNVSNIAKDVMSYATEPGHGSTVEVQNPHSTDSADKIQMSPQQWLSSYDPKFRTMHPSYAATHAYHNPYQSDQSLGYSVGRMLGRGYSKGMPFADNILNRGPLVGGMASAIPGALLGALGTGAFNMLSGNPDKTEHTGRNALLGALLTGGVGAFSSYLRQNKPQFNVPPTAPIQGYNNANLPADRINERQQVNNILSKSAFSMGTEKEDELISLIRDVTGLTPEQKNKLITGISKLSLVDLHTLEASLVGASGAALGAIITRFLMNKGLLGTAVGAILGGTVASSLFAPKPAVNYLGQTSLPSFKNYAQSYQPGYNFTMQPEDFYNVGLKLAAALNNKTEAELVALDGFISTMQNPKVANYGALQKIACKIAADAFEEAGRKDDPVYHMYTALYKTAHWFKELDLFSDASLAALGRLYTTYEKQAKNERLDDIVKAAKISVPGLVAMAGESVPEVVKNLAAVGTIGGGVAGGLYWMMNRHSNEDEADSEAIKAKIDYYNNLSNEIKRQLQTAPGSAPAAAVKKVVNNNSIF